jgi:hypothetical protein
MYENQLQNSPVGGILGAAQAGIQAKDGEISRLERSLKGLYELRVRLAGVNKSLRGNRPEQPSNPDKAPQERSLASMARQIESLIEQCHCELNETNELLQ